MVLHIVAMNIEKSDALFVLCILIGKSWFRCFFEGMVIRGSIEEDGGKISGQDTNSNFFCFLLENK